MMLMGEWDDHEVSFDQVKTSLADLASETGLSINIQRQELFDAIQKL